MNSYEKLVDQLDQEGVIVDETILPNRCPKANGLYIEDQRPVALVNGNRTQVHKRCILAEEAGHHYRSFGNILDQSTVQARKAENAGRRWAWEKILPLEYIALEKWGNPDLNIQDLAAHMDVTESFLLDAVLHYRRKHGPRVDLPCMLTVQFDPYFDVWKTDEPHEEYSLYCRNPRGLDFRHRDRLAVMARKLFAQTNNINNEV